MVEVDEGEVHEPLLPHDGAVAPVLVVVGQVVLRPGTILNRTDEKFCKYLFMISFFNEINIIITHAD